MESKKKTIILSIVAIATFAALIVGVTYAYFTAQGGSPTSTNLNVTTYTTDVFTFETGDDINIYANQSTFASGKGNATGSTFARATLTANNKTNTASEQYSLYLNITDNSFTYTIDENTPELLLTITNGNNEAITWIDNLPYKTITDGKGNQISGFDITNKNGLLTLLNDKYIGANPKTVQEWNVTITFVNYNSDQTGNTGKTLNAQLIITKDVLKGYTQNTINTIKTTKSGNELTVSLNMDSGSFGIKKYYYAIEETNELAMLDNKLQITKLSNTLAANTLTYIESDESTYTFTNVKSDAKYNVYAYAVNDKNIKTNTYNFKYSSSYNLPVITNVKINGRFIEVTATKGTNDISKYYYSIDDGGTYVESTSNSYYLSNLSRGWYNFRVYVEDVNGNKSNIYIKRVYYDYKVMDESKKEIFPGRGTINTTSGNTLEITNPVEFKDYLRVYDLNIEGETVSGYRTLCVFEVVFFNISFADAIIRVPGIKNEDVLVTRKNINNAWVDVEAEIVGDDLLLMRLTEPGVYEILVFNE